MQICLDEKHLEFAEELSWESILARWRSGQVRSGEGNDEGGGSWGGTLNSGWCATVLIRAGPCSLTIVRADSIVATRSVATPTLQLSPWFETSSSLKPIWGTSRETPFADNVDMRGRENAVRETSYRTGWGESVGRCSF